MEILKVLEIISNFLLGLMALIVTIILGIITYYIQRRQTKLQNYQLKLDLYERRLGYYQKYKLILSSLDDADYILNHTDYNILHSRIDDELKFLFDQNVINGFEKINSILTNERNTSGLEQIKYQKSRKKLNDELIKSIEELLTIRNLK